MKPASIEVVTAGLWRVMTRPRTIFLVVGGGMTALVVQTWVFTAAVLAVSLVAVVGQCRGVALWRDVIRDLRRRPIELPTESDLGDERARRQLVRLQRARRERERALACGPDQASEAALALVETAGELEAQAVAQLHSLDRLGRYLEARVVKEGWPHPGPLAPVSDADAAWALRMNDAHAEGLARLAALRTQLDARLEALTGTLGMLPCRLAILRLHERRDVICADDRELRERLEAQLAALGPTVDQPA